MGVCSPDACAAVVLARKWIHRNRDEHEKVPSLPDVSNSFNRGAWSLKTRFPALVPWADASYITDPLL